VTVRGEWKAQKNTQGKVLLKNEHLSTKSLNSHLSLQKKRKGEAGRGEFGRGRGME